MNDSMSTTREDISHLNGNHESQGSLHLSDLNDSNASQGSLHLSDLNDSNASQGSLQLSDLDSSQGSNSTATTREDSSGGRKRKSYRKTLKVKKVRKSRKHIRKSRKHIRKSRKHIRKSRKQRGGICFGNGVGANNYDPNLSIYNTRELTLFPYRPTN
jgi:hypothetical protein